jgi:hypothetical protein
MKKGSRVFVFAMSTLVAALIALVLPGLLPIPTQAASAPGTPVSKEACLECHGPFDKLVGAPASFTEPGGEKINPHKYVPHTSREAKAVPECTNCHRPHPVPPKAEKGAAQSKPDVQWCYTTCHHNNNFEPCKNCHK